MTTDKLRDEYDFDKAKARPNRFAAGVKQGGRMVVLDPDIAKAFPDSKAVNAALKKLLDANGNQEVAN